MIDTVRVTRSIPGVPVVSDVLPWCESAAIGVWIASGSAHESPLEHGAAHFVEHVLFKGTPERNGREISEAIDLVGGDLNAFTGREHTCFHVHVPAEGLSSAATMLFDVVARGSCEPEDVELERDVILDELASRADDPEDLVCDLITESVFGNDPLGRPIIGSETSISKLSSEQLRAFHQRSLRPGQVVVAAAGNIDHDALVALVAASPLARVLEHSEPQIRGLASAPESAEAVTTWAKVSQVVGEDSDSEQLFLALGRRSPGRTERTRAAAQMAAAVLGGGLSSRLFQTIREDRGLAYSVYASIDQYRSAGLMSVVAGCPAERSEELASVVGEVVESMTACPPSKAEVDRSFGHLTGSIRLGLDDPMSRMSRVGRHLLDRGDVVSVQTSLQRLRAVTPAQVFDYWISEAAPWSAAAVGPGMGGSASSGAAGLLSSALAQAARIV